MKKKFNFFTQAFIQHVRGSILNGLFAITPLLLCFFAIQLLYSLIDKRVLEFLNNYIAVRQIPGLGLLLVLVSLYLVGVSVGNFIGYRFLRFIENISKRIPLINSIYSVGKQLSQTFSKEGQRQSFKKAVLMKIDHIGSWCPVFVMNSIVDPKTKEELLFVFVPTAPAPAGGFVLVVKASETVDPGWSIEECLKIILSMGIIIPKEITINGKGFNNHQQRREK